jgi:putative membrane protein
MSHLPAVSLVLAGLAAVLHVGFFVLETVVFRTRGHHVFGVPQRDVETVAFSMYNQGFYNLFLGLGTLVGVVGSWRGWEPQGSTLVVYGCLFMVGAAAVLVAGRRSMARGAAIQGVLPLLALIAALVWPG